MINGISTIDLSYENQLIKDEFLQALSCLYDSNMLQAGSVITDLEERIAGYCGSRYAALTGSGTMAIEVAARALGISPGDHVVIPANTFVGTATALYKAGAKVILSDVDPETFNLTPEQVKKVISNKTKAICLVHLYGNIINPESFKEFNLPIIEDASHAFGGQVAHRKVGNLASIAEFSAAPMKSFGALGNCGFITHNVEKYQAFIKGFINNGQKVRYIATELGHNYLADSIQALFLSIKLKYWDELLEKRKRNQLIYDAIFSAENIFFQKREVNISSSLWVYVIKVNLHSRDKIIQLLKKQNINLLVQYTETINNMPIWPQISAKQTDVTNSELLCKQVLSLPLYPGLNSQEVEFTAIKVVAAIRAYE